MKFNCMPLKVLLLLALAISSNVNAEIDSSAQDKKFYDYIIVGVGSAGSILARKLSDGKQSVLALDIGEFRYDDPVINTPVWQSVVDLLTYDPRYAKTYPVPVGFLQAITYSEGGGSIGGGGAHNYMGAVRGTPSIYDSWAAISTDNRWLYNSLLPQMKALESYTPNGTTANPNQRGFFGPIFITQDPPLVNTTGTFYANMQSVTGSTFSSDYNDPTIGVNGLVIGANQNFVTPGLGSQRSYSAKQFLPMSGPNAVINSNGRGINGRDLLVQQNAHVLRFDIEADRAVSVDYVITNGDYNELFTACLKERGKLIIANGSVQTPHILTQSGVGPSAALQALDIPVKVDSPQVGKNLIDQYGTTATICSPTPFQQGQVFASGFPYTTAYNDRRLQFVVEASFPSPIPSCTGFFTSVAMFLLEPSSRGSINVVSSDPLLDPVVNLNMYSDGSFATNGTDANLIVSGLKIVNASLPVGFTMVSPPAATFLAGDAALFAYASSFANIAAESHIVGTARMGTNINNGVVDGRLKVFGLENVYIGNNAVSPVIENGNTNSQAYYIGQELADILGYPTPPAT